MDERIDGEVVDCGPASRWTAAPAVSPQRPAGPGVLRPAPGVLMAWASGGVVVLDLRRDRYLTLGPSASHAVRTVFADERPEPAALEPVLRAGLLTPSTTSPAPLRLAEPAEPGGVRSRAVTPGHGPSGGPIRVMRARRLIVDCDRLARTRGLAALLARLRAAAIPAAKADRAYAERLAASHDRAWLLVGAPRRSEVAVAALALDAWRAGLAVRVRLGVQRYPFHERMWVECAGRPVAAPADLGERLAPLVTIGDS
jgi:hypothetical protein